MIQQYFTDLCDIYHRQQTTTPQGYGIRPKKETTYANTPDVVDVPCHFNIGNRNINTNQGNPINTQTVNGFVDMAIGVSIHKGDKIVNKATGEAYTVEEPINVHGHHLKVAYYKNTMQESL